MKLGTWRPFESLSDYVASEDELAAKWAKEVRAARLEVARSNPAWTELEETSLIPRGPSFLVHADSDELYTIRRGEVFEPKKASVGYVSENTPLHYYVSQAGDVVFLEQQRGTWSDVIQRKARKVVVTR